MKPIALAAILFAALPIAAIAQTADDLKKDGNGGSTDNILTYGMGYHQNRYSPLKQVNRETVKRLVPVWNLSLDNNWGEQAQPIVYNGVMYVTNARATVAIDVGTGKQIWKQTLDWPPETPRVVCCGVSNKGAAIYDGKVYRTTLDAHVIAYDAKTGKEVWKTKVADWKDGISLTLAPLIANGVHGGRQLRRRVRRARLHRRLRRRDRQAALAQVHHSGQGREGQRHLAAGQQRLGSGRRLGLDHRLVRSRARPDVLGHRQPGAVGDADPRRATTSTPRRCWRCGRRPARSSGTTSSRRTTPTTTTRAGS